MNRLVATVRRDVMLQNRYRLYAVSGVMVLVWGVLLSLFPHTTRSHAAILVPPFIVFNLIVTTFYFVGALFLLEKDEGTLTAIVTTPLRDLEPLASKVITLAGLALAETLLIVVLLFGAGFQWIPLVAGTMLLGALFVLIGFISVVRYDSINAWLMPSAAMVAALVLPLLAHFGWTDPRWFIWHPTWPALRLVEAAYVAVGPGQLLVAVCLALFWLAVSFLWARRQYRRFVVRMAGA